MAAGFRLVGYKPEVNFQEQLERRGRIRMKITRKGYYTIRCPDGELLTKSDGTTRRAVTRDDCYEYITEDAAQYDDDETHIYRIIPPEYEVATDLRFIIPIAGTAPGSAPVQNTIVHPGVKSLVTTGIALSKQVPLYFTFVDETNVPINDARTSDRVYPDGHIAPVSITVSGDVTSQYSINGGTPTASPGTLNPGEYFQAHHTSSGSNSIDVDTLVTLGGSIGDAWKLPAANSMSMVPLMVIYPHPNAGVNARHLWAHTAFEYRIPVGVKGGAYPYRYEFLSAPTGATIGEEMDRTTDGITGQTLHTPGEFYGVIRWTPGGVPRTESFSVKVTDQDDNSVQLDWDVEVDDTKFVIIDSGVGASNPAGTWATPLKTLDDWYKGDDEDNTYVGRIPVLRAGSYDIIIDTSNPPSTTGNQAIKMDPAYKARGFIGVPGDMPVVDMTRGGITASSSNCNDFYVSGIRLVNSQTLPVPKDTQCVTFHRPGNRVTFFELEFDNIDQGTLGDPTDNDGCFVAIFDALNAPGINYIYLCKNTYSNLSLSDGNGALFNAYNSSYVLVERQVAVDNVASGYGISLKCSRDNQTVRYCDMDTGGVTSLYFLACTSGSKPDDHFDVEFCYNKVTRGVDAGTSTLFFSCGFGGASGDINNGAYRNTFIGGSTAIKDWSGIRPPYPFNANVIISNEATNGTYDVNEVLETYPSLRGDGNADYANKTTGDLQNASQNWRNLHLGKIGSEIAG